MDEMVELCALGDAEYSASWRVDATVIFDFGYVKRFIFYPWPNVMKAACAARKASLLHERLSQKA